MHGGSVFKAAGCDVAHDRPVPAPLSSCLGAPERARHTMSADILLTLCTCPDQASATAVATALVEERVAACVNRIGPVRSVYRWEGEVRRDDEVLLLIKTPADQFDRLEAVIRRVHPHQVPEIIGVPIAAGSVAYLDWVRQVTGPEPR